MDKMMTVTNNSNTVPTAFITGGGRRLGLHLVEFYLSQGWRVIAHYNSKNELATETQDKYSASGRYIALQADLTSMVEVAELVAQVIEFLTLQGTELDTIIHNASCFWPDDHELALTERWQRLTALQAVHVTAPQAITQGLVCKIKKTGCIIVMSDIYADLPNSRFASYCSAKAGLQNLALSWAQTFAPDVRVNIIQPGPVKFLSHHSEQYREMVLSQSLLRRELGYEAVQQGITYLMSATAITGSILKVDGGRSCINHYEQTFNH